jgi:alcohol dehydrogenase, propanol-preferring
MALLRPASGRLEPVEMPVPSPGTGQVLVQVLACGVCRTDLHVVDGELSGTRIPIVPGHEIVGRIAQAGPAVDGVAVGDRVGIGWLAEVCGRCEYCRSSRENLCRAARFTGHQVDGGYGEFVLADARSCYPLPANYDHLHAAPLLCAGTIGYRSLRMAGDCHRLGIYGFGAAAHIVAQVARHQGRDVFAFVRPHDETARQFALDTGVTWAGWSDQAPPAELDAALIFAPIGALVPEALTRVAPGGRVICAGIHMSDIPSFPYRILWEERSIHSVANLTRDDARAFLALAGTMPIRTHVESYALADANQALSDLRSGTLTGAAVLCPTSA